MKMPKTCWVLALPLLAAAALHADVLVTRDGARVETRGPWKVDGRRVVFTLPNGTLSMMRADQLDLDASKLATAKAAEAARQAAAPAAAAPAPAGPPVLTITEKDIPPVDNPDAMDAEGGDSSGQKASDTAQPDTAPLQVVSWDQTATPNNGGVQIFGTVRNVSSNNVISPTVMVAVYGDDGGLLATADGIVNQSTVAGGQTANFRVELPGVISFASAKFNFSGRGYETRKPALEADQGEGAAPAADAAAEATEASPEQAQPQPEEPQPQATEPQPEAPPPSR